LQCHCDQQNSAMLLSILKRYQDIVYDNNQLNCKKNYLILHVNFANSLQSSMIIVYKSNLRCTHVTNPHQYSASASQVQ
jgi:hypothetical protein